MSDPVQAAVEQTIHNGQQTLPSVETGLGTTLGPTPDSTGKNGHADVSPQAPTVPLVKHLPGGGITWGKKLVWLDMPEGYEGMKVRVWANYPNKFDTDIQSRDNEIMRSVLKRIFLEHNGWINPEEYELAQQEGRAPAPMPQPTSDEFWQEAPNELVGAMILLINRETLKLPNSMIEKAKT